MKIGPWPEAGRRLALLVIPLVIGLVWGTYLDDGAYVTYGHARSLANGRGLTRNALAGDQALLRAPLYTFALWLPSRLGIPLPQVGLALSALGWGVAAVAVYIAGRSMHRPVAALAAAALLVSSPVVVSTLGTEIPWVVALTWIAVAASIKKRWRTQAGLVVLIICTHADLVTLTTAILLLIAQWADRRRFPLRPALVLAVAALGWGLMASWQTVAPFSVPDPDLGEWKHTVDELLNQSELYWLFLPLAGIGLLKAARKALWVGILWAAVSILTGGQMAHSMLVSLGLFLTGWGVEWVTEWIRTRSIVRLDRFTLVPGLALVVVLPLAVAQASSIVWRYQFRPVGLEGLERQAGDWLRTRTEPAATVLGSWHVGYLADRAIIPWDGADSDRVKMANLMSILVENPPDYCVSFGSIAWDHLMQTGWFQDGYQVLYRLESPYEPASPLTIWGHRGSAFDLGERKPLSVRLPGGGGLVGYKVWPDRISAGDAVYVTLFLRPTQPVTETYHTVVTMSIPDEAGDWMQWRQVDMWGRQTVPVDWWQTGQVVSQRFVLETGDDTPVGAYRLDVTVLASNPAIHLPIYQNEDESPLDRVMLGYVAVPWDGDTDSAKPVEANLGNQIRLLGYEVPDSLSPGAEFDVTLYWEGQRPLENHYIVFVHLLDADDKLVASHDGPPMDRRYPTEAWLTGDVVPDTHHLVLDPQIPVGTYRLQVGMYLWPEGERLPVWDREGMELLDRAVVLQPVEVR